MVGLYVRVSTAEQAKEGYSIDEQIERLKSYCAAHGRSDYSVYVDGGYTGASIDRPELQRVITDVKEGKIDKVLVYKLDRLSRSQKDTLYLIEDVFLRNGCDFESMSERFDTGTSFGRAMIGILSVFAQLEREQIKERMSMGKEGRAKEGQWHGGGYEPVGYNYVNGVLEVNEYEAMQVRDVFQLYADGYSRTKIAETLNSKGYTRKNGKWERYVVARVLTNNLYIGMIKYNDSLYEGSHEAIIDRDLWSRVQKRLELEKGKQSRRESVPTYLAGLIWCGRCGARYACTAHSDGAKYRYYTCYSRRKVAKAMVKDSCCHNTNYRVEKLDGIVFDEIRKLALDVDYIRKLAEKETPKDENEERRMILTDEIRKLEEKQSRLIDLYATGLFDLGELEAKTGEVKDNLSKLKDELIDLEAYHPAVSLEEATKLVVGFADILERGCYEEIRLVIVSLIDRIVIDGEDITIHWRFC